jgi:hypothetical protein
VADGALADAKQAQVTVNAHRPPDHPSAGPPTPAEVTAERQRQYAYDDGVDALHAARRKLTEATDHRDEHAGRAARAIRESIDHDGLKDSWWDKFTNWVSEHADLLRAIARIAELVAGILSVLALVTAFIPFLNFLTPILLTLAALASFVALVCTLMLALAGEASWIDVGLALLSVVTVVGVAGKSVRLLRAGRGTRLRPDVQLKGGGRSGQNVKNLQGPPNSVVKGSPGRVYQTNSQGRVITDITKDRVKPVTPGQGFGPKRPPTQQELDWIRQTWGS